MYTTPPPPTTPTLLKLSFPTQQVLLVTINRPEAMNCLNELAHWEMERVWGWFEREAGLRCAVVTGAVAGEDVGREGLGKGRGGRARARAFCAGQDLKGGFCGMGGGGRWGWGWGDAGGAWFFV